MNEQSGLIAQWATEYEKGGIPSSTRTTPSHSVVWAVEKLKQMQFPLHEALDLGCGKGRNSLYLAKQGMHVTAMDFTPNAIRALEETAQRENLSDKIRAIPQDVTEPWPVASASMDLVIDAFCFKHIVPHEARMQYRQGLMGVLRTRAHYMISFASIGDGYYGRYVKETQRIDGEEEQLVVDPVNGIESVIFSRGRVIKFFYPELEVMDELHHNKSFVMHGENFESSTYALLLRRREKLY